MEGEQQSSGHTSLQTETCACPLCGSAAWKALPRYVTRPHQVVICEQCGLVYTNPRATRAYTEQFYENTFKSDPGAIRRGGENMTERQFDKRVRQMAPLVEPLVDLLGEPEGKRWLEVRCRHGVVAGILAKRGIEGHGVDPFAANVEFARERFGAHRFHQSSMYDLVGPAPGNFDAVGMVTIHVLAHSPNPSQLLDDCYDRLKVGGRIFILDKDVTRPRQGGMKYALSGDSAIAHFQHLTLNSLREFVRKAGFEVERAEHLERSSTLGHILVVGRKPEVRQSPLPIKADDPRLLRKKVVSLYRRDWLQTSLDNIQQRFRRLLGT